MAAVEDDSAGEASGAFDHAERVADHLGGPVDFALTGAGAAFPVPDHLGCLDS